MISSERAAPRVTVLLANVLERCSAENKTEEGGEEQITLKALITALDERAFGLGILILALPCAIPFLYGVPQIVALPMLALAAQLALGREHPWLPSALGARKVSVKSLQKVLSRTRSTLGFIEKLCVPRLRFLSNGLGAQIVGALMLIPATSILVPLPLTNSTPAVGVGVAAVGLLERDGLLILLGLALGIAWVFALIFVGGEAVSALKEQILLRI